MDEFTADEIERLQRWEAAGRPPIPLMTIDGSSTEFGVTENLATLLRCHDPIWAPVRRAALVWVDTHCPAPRVDRGGRHGTADGDIHFSTYVKSLPPETADRLVNALTLGWGALRRADRLPGPDPSTAVVLGSLAIAYGALSEARSIVDCPVPRDIDGPFFPELDEHLPRRWSTLLEGPAGPSLIHGVQTALASARLAGEAAGGGTVICVRDHLSDACGALNALRNTVVTAAILQPRAATHRSPRSWRPARPDLYTALDGIREALRRSRQRLDRSHRQIERSRATLVRAGSTGRAGG